MVDLNLHLDNKSPEARRASELARELVTARSQVMADQDMDAYWQTLERVANEVFQNRSCSPEAVLEAAYLFAALAAVGNGAIWRVAEGLRDNHGGTIEEHQPHALRAVIEGLAERIEEDPRRTL